MIIALAVPNLAFPCGNAVFLETKRAQRIIARAQQKLEAGRYRAALRILPRSSFEVEDVNLDRRIRLLKATAFLRTRRTRLAAHMLDQLNRERPRDPEIETRLGEMLSLLSRPAAQAKASKVLSALHASDLMADEFGYLALARVQARAGDTAATEQALARCRSMAREPKVCTVEKQKAGQGEKGEGEAAKEGAEGRTPQG